MYEKDNILVLLDDSGPCMELDDTYIRNDKVRSRDCIRNKGIQRIRASRATLAQEKINRTFLTALLPDLTSGE